MTSHTTTMPYNKSSLDTSTEQSLVELQYVGLQLALIFA